MEFIGLLLFLALVYIRPQEFITGILGAPLVLIVMSVTMLLWFMKECSNRTTKIFNLTQDYWLPGLMIAGVISAIKVRWLFYIWYTFIDLLKLSVFYFMTSFIINSERRMNIFIRFLVFLSAIVSFIAILQFFSIDVFKVGIIVDTFNVGIMPDIWGGIRIQGVGIFENPNYLAYSIIFSFPFAFMFLFREKGLGNRVFGLVSLIIFVIAIILTKSRGGLICFVLTFFMLFTQRKERITKIFIYTFSGLVILLCITGGFGRMGTLINMQSDEAISGRIDAWYAALQLFKDAPLIGIGYNRFQEYFRKATHSSFVQVGVETGMLGLFFWVGFIYFLVKRTNWLVTKKTFVSKNYILSLQATLVAFLITSFFATMAFRITLFIIAGLISAVERMELSHGEVEKRDYLNVTSRGFGLVELRNILLGTLGFVFIWHILIKIMG